MVKVDGDDITRLRGLEDGLANRAPVETASEVEVVGVELFQVFGDRFEILTGNKLQELGFHFGIGDPGATYIVFFEPGFCADVSWVVIRKFQVFA